MSEHSAESDVTRWRRRALFAEEAIRRALRLYHEAVRDGRTLQPTAVRDALAPQQITPSSTIPHDECPGTRFPDGTHCGECGWHAPDCPVRVLPPGVGDGP